MTHTCFSSLVAAIGLLLAAVPALSHHAAAVAYHVDREITVRGVVTEVKWENPHTWVYVDAKDATGKVVKWSFEGAVPNQLIVQRPGMMVVLTEYYHSFRLIPTDGSPHAEDMLPTYFGDSAGRWEGDTLVVDVAGFNDKTWLADARDKPNPTSRGVWLHSDAMYVVERWRMVDADTLEYQAVVTDPQVLSGPWTTPTRTLKRQPFKKIGEGMCFDTTTYDIARSAK